MPLPPKKIVVLEDDGVRRLGRQRSHRFEGNGLANVDVLPLVLRRLRVDPAVVSAPLITTIVDGTGLIMYFEIAKLVLRV